MSDETVMPTFTHPEAQQLMVPPLELAQQKVIIPPNMKITVLERPTYRRVLVEASNICIDYAHAGTHEEGGNNRGDQVEFFQHITGNNAGDSWCDSTVSTCEVKSYCKLMGYKEDRETLLSKVGEFGKYYMPVSGYCPATYKLAEARHIFFPPSHRPSPGAIVLYDFKQEGEPHHIGFFLQRDPDGKIKDVSGNTGNGIGNSDVDGVYVRHRSDARVFGWIDP